MNLFILGLVAAHFIGDWICQPRWMAVNKSKCFPTLLRHLCIVSFFLLLVSIPVLGLLPALLAVSLNAYAHGIIDWYGWKWYKRKFEFLSDHEHLNNYWFYTTIAIDQFLHLAIIIILFTT